MYGWKEFDWKDPEKRHMETAYISILSIFTLVIVISWIVASIIG